MSYINCDDEYIADMAQFEQLINGIFSIASKYEIKNPLNKDKWIEMLLSAIIGENCSISPRGFDAEGNVEYKTCEEGGSFQFHWLSKGKIEELKVMKKLYCAIRKGSTILRVYLLEGDVLDSLRRLIIAKRSIDGGINGHKGFGEKDIIRFGAKTIRG